MARPRGVLPSSTDEQVARLVALNEKIKRLTDERDREILSLADQYGSNALARSLGISEFVMQKRVARIRQALASVQQHKAA